MAAEGSSQLPDLYPTITPFDHSRADELLAVPSPSRRQVDHSADGLGNLFPTVSPFHHGKADELLAMPSDTAPVEAAAKKKKTKKQKTPQKTAEERAEEKYEFATGAIPIIPTTEQTQSELIQPPITDLYPDNLDAPLSADDIKDTEFVEDMIDRANAHTQKIEDQKAAMAKKHSVPAEDKYMLRHYQLAEVGYNAEPPATELVEITEITAPSTHVLKAAKPHSVRVAKQEKHVHKVPTVKKQKKTEKKKHKQHVYQPMKEAKQTGVSAHAAMLEMTQAAASAARVVEEAHEMIKGLRIQADAAHVKWATKVKKANKKMHKLEAKQVKTVQKTAALAKRAAQIQLQQAQEAEEQTSFARKPKAYQEHVKKYCRKKYPSFLGDPAFRTRHGQLKDPRGPDWTALCKKHAKKYPDLCTKHGKTLASKIAKDPLCKNVKFYHDMATVGSL